MLQLIESPGLTSMEMPRGGGEQVLSMPVLFAVVPGEWGMGG